MTHPASSRAAARDLLFVNGVTFSELTHYPELEPHFLQCAKITSYARHNSRQKNGQTHRDDLRRTIARSGPVERHLRAKRTKEVRTHHRQHHARSRPVWL